MNRINVMNEAVKTVYNCYKKTSNYDKSISTPKNENKIVSRCYGLVCDSSNALFSKALACISSAVHSKQGRNEACRKGRLFLTYLGENEGNKAAYAALVSNLFEIIKNDTLFWSTDFNKVVNAFNELEKKIM